MGWKDAPAADAPAWMSAPVASQRQASTAKVPQRTSQALGFAQGAFKPLDNAAIALEAGLRRIAPGATQFMDETFGGSAQDAANTRAQAIQSSGLRPGKIGEFAGNVVGTLPLAMLPGGVLAQGAAGGALLTDKRDVRGVLTDAALGAAGGAAGYGVAKGLGYAGGKAMGAMRSNPAINAQIAKADRYIRQVAKASGVDPADLMAASPDITAAEALGQTGKAQLGALARRPGETGDALSGVVGVRRMGRPTRVLNEFSAASGIDPAMVSDVPAMAETAIRNASIAPDVMQGSAGMGIHSRLNAAFDAAKSKVNALYDAAKAAKAEGAQLIREAKPIVAANLREAMADFDPQAVPRVSKHLDSLDSMKSVTARDLYEMRTRVGKLRASADPVEGEAAGTLVKAIDGEIANAIDNNAFTGDVGVIDRWRKAIAARADFGRQFQGKDAIQNLTERTYRAGQKVNRVAAEDASNVLLGKGMSGRPNDIRDLTALRDRLGADSPEWQSLQREAFSRVVGKDAGKETFGQSWNQFSQKNPQLANLLLAPEDRANLSAARNTIASAQAARDAFQNGEQRLFDPNTNARQFKASVDQMSGADLTAHRAGIANKLFNLANSGSFNPKILTVPHVQQKLEVLFGKPGAQKLIATAQREADMAAFESRYAPDAQSITQQMAEAMAFQDQTMGAPMLVAQGLSAAKNPRGAILDFALRKAQGVVDAMTTPGQIGTRNIAGQALIGSPQNMAQILQQGIPRQAAAPRFNQAQIAAYRKVMNRLARPSGMFGSTMALQNQGQR